MFCGSHDILSIPVILLSLVLPISFNSRGLGDKAPTNDDGKCELIGTFSLLTQALLGLLCLSSLIIKRSYEYPIRRTWPVWFFDVSKQLIGALGVHIFNVMLSLIKSGDFDEARLSTHILQNDGSNGDEDNGSDPCDWYFLNIVFDCTVGVYILYCVFRAMNHFCKKYLHITNIESGQYGPDVNRPSVRAYLKQLTVYFTSLMITKILLYIAMECFETQLLWITKHILLVWLDEYPDELEIFIVMFVVPIFMNCLQLVLIDNFIRNQVWSRVNKRMHDEHPDEYEYSGQSGESVIEREIADLLAEELSHDKEIARTGRLDIQRNEHDVNYSDSSNSRNSSNSSTLVDGENHKNYGTFGV
ncbi:vacuolar membrane protein-domain-containing protein [Scheffersomyces xylosifermentans]|uniref:vacuolar membrane protein-domain-containing protein n=1 Tax=Scheffersomyces xylosifermentans TaxID=1304137 RepID=UPI00315D5713